MISPHNFRRNRKGVGTIFAMVFFLIIVMIVFGSFVVILNQNTGLQQTITQANQMDSDKAKEELTITGQATYVSENTVDVTCNLDNTGRLPVQVVRLWVKDLANGNTGTLSFSNPNSEIIIPQGENHAGSFSVTVSEATSDDTFIFWFITARGNQFTLQDYGDAFDITNQVTEITASIMGDFLPDYHSVQWGECLQVGSNYEVSHWTSGWTIPQDEDFNMVWRVNCSYKGSTPLTLDQNSMLFFIPSMARNPGEHALNPFMCYIVESTTVGGVSQIAPYPGHELTILPKTNVTLYFGTQVAGYGSDDDYGFSNLIFGDMDASMMSLTIYGKSPSAYAQSFPLFAVIPRLLRITLDSYDDTIGSTVSVTGVGFARNSIITLKYDSNTLSTSPSSITSE